MWLLYAPFIKLNACIARTKLAYNYYLDKATQRNKNYIFEIPSIMAYRNLETIKYLMENGGQPKKSNLKPPHRGES